MTEKQFQSELIRIAKRLKWHVFHAPDNRPNSRGKVQNVTPGFPDLVLVKGNRLVFAELKTDTGRVTPAQEEWLAALEITGAETYVWRPKNWQEIVAVLRKEWQ